MPFPWLVSYDDAPEIRALYRGYRKLVYTLRYTAAKRQQGAEVMFLAPDVIVPRGVTPQARDEQGSPARASA